MLSNDTIVLFPGFHKTFNQKTHGNPCRQAGNPLHQRERLGIEPGKPIAITALTGQHDPIVTKLTSKKKAFHIACCVYLFLPGLSS